MDALNEARARRASSTEGSPAVAPVSGICVGMQVLFEAGVEGGHSTPGLGQWPGIVTELQAPVLPHMGWNTVDAPGRLALCSPACGTNGSTSCTPSPPLAGICRRATPFSGPSLTWAEHGTRFLAAVENGPLSATQFHPEKSGVPGIRLLSNWVAALHSD